MQRASKHFTDEDRRRIAEAVAGAEAKTSAEIVPVVATASGRYDRAEDLIGLLVGLGAMILAWLLFQREDPTAGGWDGLPLTLQLPALVVILLAGFAVGAVAATWLDPLRRLFTPAVQMGEEVAENAARLFFDQRVHHTAASSGILVFVSLFERRAAVLADETAFKHLGQATLDDVCRALTSRLRTGDVTAALCETIGRLGDLLADKLPRADDDEPELGDALVVIG